MIGDFGFSILDWKRAPVAAALALAAGAGVSAQPAPAGDVDGRLREGEVRQDRLRTRTVSASGRMAGILDEYLRNALEGEDAAVLAAAGESLTRITDEEMVRIVALLQEARRDTAPEAVRGRVADAYGVQKGVVAELERILIECRRRVAVHELAARFERLMLRQDTNLWSVLALGRESPALSADYFDERRKTALRLQRTEQEALAQELGDALERMGRLAAETETGAGGALAAALGAARGQGLSERVDGVRSAIEAGRLFYAAAEGRRARNTLRTLARGLVPPRDAAEALRRAVRDVDREIARQERLLEETRPSHMHRYESLALEHRQAEIMDKTELVQGDVKELAPPAAALLGGASDEMLQARVELESDLAPTKNARVVAREEAALELLRKAREALGVALVQQEHSGAKVTMDPHGMGLGKSQSGMGRALGKEGSKSPKGIGSGTGKISEGGGNLGDSAEPGGPMQRNVPGAARVIALPPRDRAVIVQSRTEPVPAEYAPLVEAYLRSLAGDDGAVTPGSK
jgi:hypothetical protein